ncbi:MAG: hypothetical protein ACJ8FY_11400 [Gemmataceae bacterium]
MIAGSTVVKHEEVRFHFLSDKENSELTGTVIVRDGEMVLNIPGGYGPYLIASKSHEHRYGGTSTVRGKSNRVEARWADMGWMYVGVWVEDGCEYLFSFELPTT